ncbi:MAG: hypothetical protein OEZ58_11370 [Gammaproteobacteria bacterium]|nr:hypothetical protein [Gammaproteobacteria bacterium]MDH5729583.1 hypothetical protein [Gammaproteobacteria bacterium]
MKQMKQARCKNVITAIIFERLDGKWCVYDDGQLLEAEFSELALAVDQTFNLIS